MPTRKKKRRTTSRRSKPAASKLARIIPHVRAARAAASPLMAAADVAAAPWHLAALEVPQLQAMGLTGRGIRIGVVDTGVETDHPQLGGRRLRALDVGGAGGDGRDFNGHGTQMVGLIVGRQGAIAPEASIVSVKTFMAGPFGTSDDIAAGIETALAAGVDVLSLSVGTTDASPRLVQAVQQAIAGGVVVVGAGEDGEDDAPLFPAALTPVIAATAATRDNNCLFDVLPAWLDVACPGVDLLTTVPGGGTGLSTGTSPATAVCAGICALLLGLAPAARRRALAAQLMTFLSATGVLPGNAAGPNAPRLLAPVAAAAAIQTWLRQQ
jgi:subtilisin family serine protease